MTLLFDRVHFILPGILWRASLRYMRCHPWQMGLSILGVALGVAVVVAIDVASSSAQRAFELSTEALSGNTTHQIITTPNGVPEQLYRQLRLDAGVRNSAPVVEGSVTVATPLPRMLQLLGIDPLAESPFRSYSADVGGEDDLTRLLTLPGAVLITRELAATLSVKTGDAIVIGSGEESQQLTVVGFISADDSSTLSVLRNVLLADIATAQEVLGMEGILSRIDLFIADDDNRDKTLTKVRNVLSEGAQIVEVNAKNDALKQMTRAFHTNLAAMSLLALVVGMFIIFNAMTFSVLRRRSLFGALRALGVTRSELWRLILGEAIILGLVGTTVGLILGIALSFGLIHLVARTINDLYFALEVTQIHIAASSISKGVLLGVGASVVATIAPAMEATRTQPRAVLNRSVIEGHAKRLIPWLVLAGFLFLLLGLGLLLLPSKALLISFVALFLLLIGYSLLVPTLTIGVLRVLQPLCKRSFGLIGSMAVRGIEKTLSRTGIAIAALVIAVATTVGVTTMIGSFRLAVDHWLQDTFRADIYLSLPENSTDTTIDPLIITKLARLQGVTNLSQGRRVELIQDNSIINTLVLNVPREGFSGYRFKEGNPDQAWRAFSTQKTVIVSEPFAYHRNLSLGDDIVLPTGKGPVSFRIAGVFYDYSSDSGVVVINRKLYDRYWSDPDVKVIGVYLAKENVDVKDMQVRIEHAVATIQNLQITDSQSIREISLDVFDRTFAITHVLRLLTVLVAVVGIFSALMALQLERAREFAVLRALGLTPRQLWQLITLETGLSGLIAGVLALPLGLIVALELILDINQRSFGWSMAISVEPMQLLSAVLLAIGAAIVAGIYPAYKMAKVLPAAALRNEE